MTDDRDEESLSLAVLEVLARAHGYEFSRERLAAVLPEVRRLRAMLRHLRALAPDDEPPAVWPDHA